MDVIDICIGELSNPNLWSYLALASYKLNLMDKQERSEKKRRILEFIVRQARLPKDEINGIIGDLERSLKGCGYEVRRVKIVARSPALIGGSESFGKTVFEVALHFDPILNFPYIPGSTIKGAVRAGVFTLLTREGTPKEEAERRCRRIFGDAESAGLVGFTDAYPIKEGEGGFILHPDVMTPHYTSRTESELDVSPTPIVHLTIAPGTTFQFYLFSRRRRGIGKGERKLEDSDLTEKLDSSNIDREKLGIVDLGLLYAFYRGVGAKTSVGYSSFKVTSYEVI
ncbi:MAG: type III-B CRISPR module RAMP protein Cmr6 [Candidatus Korarchaeum sp.]